MQQKRKSIEYLKLLLAKSCHICITLYSCNVAIYPLGQTS